MIWFPTKSRLRTSLSAQHSLANTDDVTNPMRSPRLNNNKVIWEGWGGCGGCCRGKEKEVAVLFVSHLICSGFFHQPPHQHTPISAHPPPLPFLLHHHLPLETYRGRCSANPECWAEITGCCCVCVRHTELKVYTHLRHSIYTAWVFQELQTLNQHDKTNHSSYFKTTRKAL